MSRLMTLKNITVGVVLAGSLGIGGAGLVLAQDEAVTPSHPAHIHVGTCDDLDPNPLAPLTNIEPSLNEDSDDENANSPQGVLTTAPVLYSLSDEIDLSFEDDVLATSHSINVHESDENIQNYIACGEIGGSVTTGPGMDQGGTLVIGLRELNDSGVSGVAVLEGMGDQTEVSVYLAEGLSGMAGMMGDATPTS